VHVFNLIKDVQKKFKTREQEKRELEVGWSVIVNGWINVM